MVNENKLSGSASNEKKGTSEPQKNHEQNATNSQKSSASGETVGTKASMNAEASGEPNSKAKVAVGSGLSQDTPSNASFSDKLYEKITEVIGGDNPNQFFCMGLPGTLVDKTQYSYDIEKNEPKPAFVEANESKLVNKLFDACTMTASDNGRQLQMQYKTALDMLTPKLNRKLFEAKTKLRKVLMTPYPYNFGDGTVMTGLTLQQVFYKLYSGYVTAKQQWAQMQLDRKNELHKKYSGGSVEDNRAFQNEYLDWYEATAESQILNVEEKLGMVLNVFSPSDMEIITAILESGAGSDIAEARQTLANVAKLNPDGGHIYPVTLYPENWFTLLDTSFTPVDLLESPAALSQKMSVLIAQRNNLTTQIHTLTATIPGDEQVATMRTAYKNAEDAYNKAFTALSTSYTNVTIDILKTFMDVVASTSPENVLKDVPAETTARIFGVEVNKVEDLLDKLGSSAGECIKAQSELNAAATTATSAAITYFQAANQQQYKQMLIPLQAQLQSTNDEIAELKDKLGLAAVVQKNTNTDKNDTSDVAPNSVPDNFTQIIITSSMAEANRQSASAASASQSSYGSSFFFGGYSNSKSHAEAVNQAFASDSSIEIQIGMSVAKVKIGREWFNPGVFLLSADMYNTSSGQIAPAKAYTEFNDERFQVMNQCIFPCYPTAFVIARDVTIKFVSASNISNSFAQSVEDHSASAGGFFIFSGSSASSSSSSQSNSKATSTANSVTVRFTGPQILGYYLEATPPDKSESISGTQSQSDVDDISIFDFINDFQVMLNDYNKTYNKQSLQMEI